jgi:uncharacterized membrane protein
MANIKKSVGKGVAAPGWILGASLFVIWLFEQIGIDMPNEVAMSGIVFIYGLATGIGNYLKNKDK